MAGESCTLSLCVHSAELDASTHDAYCKLYLDSHDLTGGTGLGSGNNHHHAESPSPLDDHREDGPRSFHTQPDRSAKKTSSPLWNETFTADVYDRRNEILTIRVKSKKLLHVSAVGACAIPLRQIPVGRPVDQWFPLQKGNKRRGKIRLQLTLTYTSAPPSATTTAPTAGSSPWSSASATATPSSPDAPANYQPRSSVDRRRSTGPRRSSLEPATPPISAGRMSSSSSLSRASVSSSSGPKQQQWQTIASASSSSSSMTSPPLNASVPPPSSQQPPARPLYQPEEEPVKTSIASPQKLPPQPRPVLTSMESDDDEDEAGFPRVAELHRLESDLIGEYSDDEGGFGTALESKASSYSIKMEAVVEESAKQLTTALSSDVEIARQTINHHVAHEELTRLEQLRSPVNQDADADDRSSIEISRQTRVAVPASELAKLASSPLAAHIDEFVESDHEEGEDEGDAKSKLATAVVEPEKRANGDTEIWNRYPSSSSSEDLELQLPFPDEPLSESKEPSKEEALRRSSAEAAAVVESDVVNPFVEPASPSDSEGEEHVDTAVHVPSDEHDHEHPIEAAAVVDSDAEDVVVGIAVEVEEDMDVVYAVSVQEDSTSLIHEDVAVAVATTETESGASHSRVSSSSSLSSTAEEKLVESAHVVQTEAAKEVALESAAAVAMQQHDVDVRSTKSVSVSSTHSKHSFVSEDVQHSFVSEMPEHSFVSEQADHSFVSEMPDHSFVSEAADHSFVSEAADHSFVSEPPSHSFVSEQADHSFVSEQADHSFVSEAADHSFVSEEPGHSFVSDDPGHSFVSERPPYAGEHRRHSFISASAVISQSASITEEPRHSFIAEETTHSFISESSDHSFISESPQHSFVSDDPGHSFVSEHPSGESFVATASAAVRHTHSFVSEDEDHSFVSDDPGHSFVSERPGHSVVSETDVATLSATISEGDENSHRVSRSSSSSDDEAPPHSASSFIEELAVDSTQSKEEARESLSSEEDPDDELSLVGVYHEDVAVTHTSADNEVVEATVTATATTVSATVDRESVSSSSSSSSSASRDRLATSSFIEELADDETAERPSSTSSYAAPAAAVLSPRASILSSDGVRDSDVQEPRMSERMSFRSSPRSSAASFSQIEDVTLVAQTTTTTEILRSSVVSSLSSSSSSEAAEEEQFTQHLDDDEVDVRYSTVSSVTTNGHEDPTLSHTWIDEPATNVELLDLLRRVSRASDADDLSPPTRPVDASAAVVEPIQELPERSEALTSTLLSTGEPERDPEEIAKALAQAIAAAQQESAEDVDVVEEETVESVRSRASSSSSSSDDEEMITAPTDAEPAPVLIAEAPIAITVKPKVMVVQPSLSLSSMDVADSCDDEKAAQAAASEAEPQPSSKPVPARVAAPDTSSVPTAAEEQERPMLRHMSTTLTATQLELAADDCLPSDSDDSSVCGSDDEFNFDSDSD